MLTLIHEFIHPIIEINILTQALFRLIPNDDIYFEFEKIMSKHFKNSWKLHLLYFHTRGQFWLT